MTRSIVMPRYAVLVLIVVAALGPVLSIVSSVKIADTSARQMLATQEKTKAEAQAEAQKANRILLCAFLAANLDTYDETPPSTPAGKKQRQTNLDFYLASGCQPPRK